MAPADCQIVTVPSSGPELWQLRPGKRGNIAPDQPPALRRLGLDPSHWTGKVKGIGSGYWRIVGSVEDMIERAAASGQQWMKGIGYARKLATNR